MTQEQKRIAIAEACPTVFEVVNGALRYRFDHQHAGVFIDPLNDLNACHEMIAYLKPEQVDQFAIELSAIVLENDYKSWWDLTANEVGQVANATAAQRCEAFLRALDLWEDEE